MSDRVLRVTPSTSDGPTCHVCGQPASCVGRYDDAEARAPACDQCCGHGCEDGRCWSIDDLALEMDVGDLRAVAALPGDDRERRVSDVALVLIGDAAALRRCAVALCVRELLP